MKEVDLVAKQQANGNGMPSSLHLPVCARDKVSITRFVGDILLELSRPNSDNAFLIEVPTPLEINKKLGIWKLDRSELLHTNLQVWVHINYRNYRNAYKKAFPNENIDSLVLNHLPNRRMAALMGFNFVRIVPVSREVNSSSAFSEKWGVAYHSSEHMRKVNRELQCYIHYADLPDIVTILNIMPGGGVMDAVNKAQKLMEET